MTSNSREPNSSCLVLSRSKSKVRMSAHMGMELGLTKQVVSE